MPTLPPDLVQLIEELESAIDESSVTAEKNSKAVIYTEYSPASEAITLTARHCVLLLHSEHTVAQLYEAIGSPGEATITLHDLILDGPVITALERLFNAVDEQ